MAQRRIEYQGECFDISYERVNHTDSKQIATKPIILFLHGWGSNKDVMKIAFSKCFHQYEHIYIDMPGFGNSPNDKPLFTSDYAQIVQIFLRDVCGVSAQEVLMVGHSFGGKVALLCEPKEVILLSSAGIKVPKSIKVRCKIAFAKIMGQCGFSHLGKMFRSKDVIAMNEGMYQTFKNVVDEDFSGIFRHYKGKASIFWGRDDRATPLFCGERIAALIQDSRFFVLEGDHYFFLRQGEGIEKLYGSNI
ncbi:alpha/beta hydrolase [Helicobacter mastomyrinus]|uniref:Alpha/beta hydrolase n=4 Tax=Helicobacter TaxID=209 RepID=A0ABZ3F515_9HELI|nr:alpha/beta hydrolase [uncultured Helicobacter sp.]